MGALEAAFWGFAGGVSLLVGAVAGIYLKTPQRVIALIMAFGAGVLISSVAFELMEEAYKAGGFPAGAIGLTLGALAFFGADHFVSRSGGAKRKRSQGQQADGSSTAIVIGAVMDGIPESVAIGVSLLKGGTVSWVFVVAVFLSNVPEALAASAGMKKAGKSNFYILALWATVVAVSALSALLGYSLMTNASGNVVGIILSFAAGSVLTMLASTMIPEAYEEGGPVVGLATTLGFLVAFMLSAVA